MILTKQLRKINNFCIELNRIYPTTLMNLIEIDPISPDHTEVLCKWFKIVLAVKKWNNNDFEYFSNCLKDTKNILIMNDDPQLVSDKFSKEFVDVILINSGDEMVYYAWQDKIYKKGFICGLTKNKRPRFIKPDKKYKCGYWLAKKE